MTSPGVECGPGAPIVEASGVDGLDELRQPEVDDLRVAVVGDHHVGRLQIAVNQALLVRAAEALRDLDAEVERAFRLRAARVPTRR